MFRRNKLRDVDTCWINIVGKKEDKSIKATYKVDKIEELYGII